MSSKKESQKKVGQDFAFKLRYHCELPPVPFDPVLLKYPHAEDRLYKYKETSLLSNYQYELVHPDGDQGLPCNPFQLGLCEKEFQTPNYKLAKQKLDPKDEALMVKPVDKKLDSQGVINVPWLRRSEFISAQRNAYGRGSKKDYDKKYVEKEFTIDEQIEAIKNTFEKARNAKVSTLQHPRNKNLKAIEIIPVFPDLENWDDNYCMVTFDEDPIAERKETLPADQHLLALEESLLKPLALKTEDRTESWMAYYTPTKDTISKIVQKRKLEEQDQYNINQFQYEYKFQREFDHQASQSNYPFFLQVRTEEGGAFYSPIQNQLKLKKRRALSKRDRYYSENIEKPTRILMKHRQQSSEEREKRKNMMQDLFKIEAEDEDF
ncbi:RNA polymerase-associated factor [Boothiomyces sp. JEL0866]|nr:RNA polymerase-associated factor [Boothiomyces sp. JEL0866]